MTLTIERVPMPRPKQWVTRNVYPWLKLDIGESFLYSGNRKTGSAVASKAGKRHGRKFATRFTQDGLRIWRIK